MLGTTCKMHLNANRVASFYKSSFVISNALGTAINNEFLPLHLSKIRLYRCPYLIAPGSSATNIPFLHDILNILWSLMRDACVTEGTTGAVRYHTTVMRGREGDNMSPRCPHRPDHHHDDCNDRIVLPSSIAKPWLMNMIVGTHTRHSTWPQW